MGYGPFGKKKPSPQSPQTPFELMPNNPLLQPVRQDNGTIFNPQNGKVIDPLTGMTLVDPGAANYKSVPHNPLAWAQKHFGAQNFGGLQRGAGNGGQTGGMPPMGNSNTSGMGVMGSPVSGSAGPAVSMPAEPAPQPVGQPRDWTANDFMNLLMIERAKNQQEADAALKSAAFWGPIKKLALGTIAATSPYNANVAYHGMKNVSNGITAANQAYANAFDPSMPLAAAKILAENNPAKYDWHKDKAENDREALRIKREASKSQAEDRIAKQKIAWAEHDAKVQADQTRTQQFKDMLERKDRELEIAAQNAQTSEDRNKALAQLGVVRDAKIRLDAEASKQGRLWNIALKATELNEFGEPKYPGLQNIIKNEDPKLYQSLFGAGAQPEEKPSPSPIDGIMQSVWNFMSGNRNNQQSAEPQNSQQPAEQPVEPKAKPAEPQTGVLYTKQYAAPPKTAPALPAQPAPKPAPALPVRPAPKPARNRQAAPAKKQLIPPPPPTIPTQPLSAYSREQLIREARSRGLLK